MSKTITLTKTLKVPFLYAVCPSEDMEAQILKEEVVLRQEFCTNELSLKGLGMMQTPTSKTKLYIAIGGVDHRDPDYVALARKTKRALEQADRDGGESFRAIYHENLYGFDAKVEKT